MYDDVESLALTGGAVMIGGVVFDALLVVLVALALVGGGLLALHKGSWGTRASVEVRAEPARV